jgi:hypothetical protein
MPKETSEVKAALTDVLGGLLSFAEEERRKEEPYQMLFGAFKDGGVAKAVFEANQKMESIAMDLMQLLGDKTGLHIDNDVFATIMGLPLAMYLAERDIEKKEGSACCVDKAHLLMRTYLYQKLGLDVEKTPYVRQPRPERKKAVAATEKKG